jgi:nitrite reductase/ring-hydroxylating ferredoxin subunit
MTSHQYTWHKIAASDSEMDFGKNRIRVADVNGKKICLGLIGQSVYGFAYTCPHAGAMLNEGYIDGAGNVVCPVHGYRFSISNGRNTTGEGFHLKTYPVEIREDGVYLGIKEYSL